VINTMARHRGRRDHKSRQFGEARAYSARTSEERAAVDRSSYNIGTNGAHDAMIDDADP